MPRIAMLPQTRTGEITLQAKPADWKEAARTLQTKDTSLRGFAQMIDHAKLTEPVTRFTLPEDKARAVLRALGLAS